jgi:hypothetical protein
MKYKISGHEKFTFRYSWFPKVYRALKDNPKIFSNEDEAMVEIGVGKNMVRSIRFWSIAANIIQQLNNQYVITEFGDAIFSENGFDPYLEDIRTLWLIHWNLSNSTPPLFAWNYLLNQWYESEIAVSEILLSINDEDNSFTKISERSLKDHLDIFFRSYVPTRGFKGPIKEDNLDSPLVELEFIQKIGDQESKTERGKSEPIYRFRREDKPEINSGLFIFCIYQFFEYRHSKESTLSFRDISIGNGSPGQIFKLSENNLRNRLEHIERQSKGLLIYKEASSIQQLQKKSHINFNELLEFIYQ